mgnify:CR=1 FL=1
MRLLKKCKTLRAALGGRLARMGRRGRWELSVLLGLALAALGVASRPEMRGKHIVTFACDTGERYMSTALFQDQD